jgi:nucleoside-diphosphate-sugar epimerase
MKIIILGAGRVGESVAESLVSERNDITVIDTDAGRLRDLEDRLDLRGVVGNGIQPSVLRQAGADDADMVIAHTTCLGYPPPLQGCALVSSMRATSCYRAAALPLTT